MQEEPSWIERNNNSKECNPRLKARRNGQNKAKSEGLEGEELQVCNLAEQACTIAKDSLRYIELFSDFAILTQQMTLAFASTLPPIHLRCIGELQAAIRKVAHEGR